MASDSASQSSPATATPSKHIRLTSHPGQQGAGGAPAIRWGAATASERGPVVGTTTNRSQRNVIGTHSGSYGVYRALAVAAGNLVKGHRADLTNTAPTDVIGPYPQWGNADRIVSIDPWGASVADVFSEQLANGIDIRPIRTMMNHATTEVFFDNLRIPADALVGEEGKGFRYILSGMNSERILIAAECIGDAKWFLKKGSDYAKERVVFGAPIGRNQGVQFPLARAHAHMMAAEAIVYRAAGLYDAGHNPGVEANTAKMLAADASWEAAEACLQTHGGFGFAEEYDVERKFREARLYQVAPISTNLILCYIAEQVLGLPKSYGEGRG